MSAFFSTLISQDLIQDWASTLDWLFDDNRFDSAKGWTPNRIGSFTKKAKRLPEVSADRYTYEYAKLITFPAEGHNIDKPTFYFTKGTSEGRDLIRHIRNGIAHGKTRCYKNANKEMYIEICDFGKEGTKMANHQSAFFALPISMIPELHKLYSNIQNSFFDKSRKVKKRKGK